MKVDVDAIFEALAHVERSFDLVRQIGDTVGLILAESGQPQLQERLATLRAENDAARARRHAKLTRAAEAD